MERKGPDDEARQLTALLDTRWQSNLPLDVSHQDQQLPVDIARLCRTYRNIALDIASVIAADNVYSGRHGFDNFVTICTYSNQCVFMYYTPQAIESKTDYGIVFAQ